MGEDSAVSAATGGQAGKEGEKSIAVMLHKSNCIYSEYTEMNRCTRFEVGPMISFSLFSFRRKSRD